MTILIGRLRAQRPVFHSEADLQHHLAWAVHQVRPALRIRLEVRLPANGHPMVGGQRSAVDILLNDLETGKWVAVELKYLKRDATISHDGEQFQLHTGASDIGAYDTIKAVQRIERWIGSGVVDFG